MKKSFIIAALALFVSAAFGNAGAFAETAVKKEKKEKKQKKQKKPSSYKMKMPELKNGGDSVAYTFGVWQAMGLKNYMQGQLHVDTNYVGDFSRGIMERIDLDPSDKKVHAYNAGQQIGQQIENMAKQLSNDYYAANPELTIDKRIVAAAIIRSLLGTEKMDADSAQVQFQSTMAKRTEVNKEALYGENRRQGEQWLAENKKKEGVITLPSGLQYKVLFKGNGDIPTRTQRVKVNYEGHLIDGTEFDSSYKRNQPSTFRADQVIKGWTEALCKMPVGSKWELYIPQELAYGDRDSGKIKPYSALIFTVELLEIVK